MSEDGGSGEVVDTRDSAVGPGDCAPSLAHDLTTGEIAMDTQLFSALANDTRYEVLRYLAAADEEVCACHLVPELDVNQSTTSRALKALYEAGLVDRRKDGRWRYYSATDRAEKLLGAVDSTREQ